MLKFGKNPGQKRILTVEDISCFGKCSLTVALPILSAFGHESVILPTALLSTHTADCFENFYIKDLTDTISPICDHWIRQGIEFDCIYTGYLCAGRQTDEVVKLIEKLRTKDTVVVADPAMADGGKLYTGFDLDHVEEMKKLCLMADIITPNVTEAAFLCGVDPTAAYDKKGAEMLIDGLRKMGCKGIILITSVAEGDSIGVVGSEPCGCEFEVFCEKQDAPKHGSGDVFTSALVGAYMSGDSIHDATEFAVNYTVDAICATSNYKNSGHEYGLVFENVTDRITKKYL